ncbi:hypothetical protein TW65_08161 [Stemphylium lycopersici]|uniref:Malate dehydrogenase n=1 Tax=Stemphylium lycopersici TaxID=183478 RepID=A0A364MU75_STELY|nr:hypothetical protein TW65_08161 [Stemphylium lycopersici]RAR03761.1 hypothetical protein DDE83_008095 [Stemphylium lycopersici]
MHTSFFFAAFAFIPVATAAPRPPFYAPGLIRPRENCQNETATNTTTPTEPALPSALTCDLSSVRQPSSALVPPPSTMSLVLVALGQGTQNYTCSNSTAAPAAIGALAQLFNASCALSSDPTASTTSLGSIEESASIGKHFFLDNTTPDFDISGLGNTVVKKVEDVAAPDAVNDVKWLRLEAQQGASTSDVKMVYRLNTVGGIAPTSCEGTTAGEVMTVPYEAQYWVYT